jgi:hypothetical protein
MNMNATLSIQPITSGFRNERQISPWRENTDPEYHTLRSWGEKELRWIITRMAGRNQPREKENGAPEYLLVGSAPLVGMLTQLFRNRPK